MNKVTNIIGVIVGVLGLAFGIYAFYSTRHVKQIYYNLSGETFKIIDNELLNNSKSLSLYKNDSILLKQNVYLTVFSVWNSGNEAINPSDGRREIELKFDGIKEILDYHIIKIVDNEASCFELKQLTPSSLSLKWKYFDPKDGVKFQLIFTGKNKIIPIIKGKILNTEIKEYVPLNNRPHSLLLLFLSPIILILSIVMWKSTNNTIKKNADNIRLTKLYKSFKVTYIILFFSYLFTTIYYYYLYFFSTNNLPF